MTARYTSGSELFDRWRSGVSSGVPPVTFPVAPPDHPLVDVDIGPGKVILVGGSPGSGKTTLNMQMTFDAVALTPELRAVVCNVEMSPEALLDRQLARLSGIPLGCIVRRTLAAEHADRLSAGLSQMRTRIERVAFVRPPFDLANVARTADAVGADLIVLDYVQRIGPPKEYTDKRMSVNATMDAVRVLADGGCGVMVVSAVGRQKDTNGRSSYDGLTLASFRESSELEYGADSAYLLVREADSIDVTLKCVKNRSGEPVDIPLTFDGAHQRFDPPECAPGPRTRGLAGVWQHATGANHDDAE